MNQWHVAKTKPNKEAWVTENLQTLGAEVFYPKILRQRRGRRVTEPLFPTYVFSRFDSGNGSWTAIRWAPGLNYFLYSDDRLATVPDDFISYLRDRVDRWNGRLGQTQTLKAGDRVSIVDGPFAGLEGIFQEYVPARKRCRLFLQVVGRLTSIEMPESALQLSTLRF